MKKRETGSPPGVKLGRVSGFSKPGFRVFGFFKKKKKKNGIRKKKIQIFGWCRLGRWGRGGGGAPTPPSKKKNILPTQTNPRSELGIIHMKRQQGSLANFGFSTSVARVRVKQDVGTEVGEGYTSPVLQIYAPKLLGQIQKSPAPHFLVGFLNFAQKSRNFFFARYARGGAP